MRILVTGANGQLGNEMQVLAKENPQHTYILQMCRSWTSVIRTLFGHILLKSGLSLLLIVRHIQQ